MRFGMMVLAAAVVALSSAVIFAEDVPAPAAGGETRVASPYFKLPEADPAPTGPAVKFMPAVEGKHPRLLLTADRLPALKAFFNSPEGKLYHDQMIGYLAECKIPKDGKTNHGWGQEVGLMAMPMIALHYTLTGDKKSFDQCMEYMKWLDGKDDWTDAKPDDKELNSDTTASFTMVGASLMWDWLYNDLDPAFREKFRQTLWFHARAMYYGGHLAKNPGGDYWRGVPAYNHRWFRDWGLTLAATAASDGKPEDQWLLGQITKELQFMEDWLPIDGSQHEGPGYGSSAGALGLAFQVSDDCYGTKHLASPFFKTVGEYAMHEATPGLKEALYFADCFTHAGSMHPFFLKTAALNKEPDVIDGIRQSLKINSTKFGVRDYAWMSLLCDDPALQGGSYKKMPTVGFFPDLGLMDVRDTWNDDAVAALFKCGPMGGYKANSWRKTEKEKTGVLPYVNVAHDHPDANSFALWSDGDYVAETDRYPMEPGKLSSSVNTILINGLGQAVVGRQQGDSWQQPGNTDMTEMGKITAFKDAGDVVVVEGEAAGSYLDYTDKMLKKSRPALDRFRRTFIFVKWSYVLVLDDVRSPKPVDITWLMQGAKLEKVDEAAGKYRLSKGKSDCEFQLVADTAFKPVIGLSTANDHSKSLKWQQLQATANGSAVRFASVFDPWHHKDLKVTLKADGPDKATVTVEFAGFTDTWDWQAATGKFTASTVHGSRKRGFDVTVDEKAVPPAP